MGLLSFIKTRKTLGRASKLAELTAPTINTTYQLVRHEIEQNVAYWNLGNDVLMTFLGYIAGVLDAGEYILFGRPGAQRDGQIIIDLDFHQAISAYLNELPGADVFLEMDIVDLEARVKGKVYSSGAISGMQTVAAFRRGQAAGGGDFLELIGRTQEGKNGWFPQKLMELLLELKSDQSSEWVESIPFDSEIEANKYANWLSGTGKDEVRVARDSGGFWTVLTRKVD